MTSTSKAEPSKSNGASTGNIAFNARPIEYVYRSDMLIDGGMWLVYGRAR